MKLLVLVWSDQLQLAFKFGGIGFTYLQLC
jgi:hypothetical protein